MLDPSGDTYVILMSFMSRPLSKWRQGWEVQRGAPPTETIQFEDTIVLQPVQHARLSPARAGKNFEVFFSNILYIY